MSVRLERACERRLRCRHAARLAVITLAALGGCKPSTTPPPPPASVASSQPPAATATAATAPAPVTAPAGSSASNAPLAASPSPLDIGVVPPGGAWSGTLKVSNTSDRAVTISEVKTNCSCTTVDPNRGRVIQPGQAVDISVNFRAKLSPSSRTQKIWVALGPNDGPPLEVTLLAEIAMQVQATPSSLKAYLDEKTGIEPAPFGTVVVRSADARPFQVLSSNGTAPVFADGYKLGDPPRSSYTLEWDLRPYISPDCVGTTMPWWWVIETDHPDCPLIDLRVMHDCTRNTTNPLFPPPVQGTRMLPDLRANAGAVRTGESGEFIMSVGKLRGFNLVKVESLTPELISDATIIGASEDGGDRFYTCRFTPAPGHRGLLMGLVKFTADDGWTAPMFVIAVVRD
jgi:hypothetical protein